MDFNDANCNKNAKMIDFFPLIESIALDLCGYSRHVVYEGIVTAGF